MVPELSSYYLHHSDSVSPASMTSRSNSSISSHEMSAELSTATAKSKNGKPPKQIQTSVQGFEPIPKKSAIIKTDKPRPHICTTCTRAFARYEHLKRHERSHTNEKPFQCAACGRCFARRDLVLRHQQKLHTGLTTNNTKDALKKGDNANIITNYGNKEVLLPTINAEGQVIATESINPPPQQKSNRGRKPKSYHQQQQQIHEEQAAKIEAARRAQTEAEQALDFSSPESLNLGSSLDQPTSLFKSQPFKSQYLDEQSPEEQKPVKRHRHNSFSATSAFSYTRLGENDTPNPNRHELPEGPQQVGFATPQLSAQELNSKALMSGIDLDALGLQYDPEEFSLDGPANNNNSNNGSSDYFRATKTGPSGRDTPYQFNITPGGSLLDMPIMNEYLHMGGAGGGAGFSLKSDKLNFNLFAHDSRKKKRTQPQLVSNGSTPTTILNDEKSTSLGLSLQDPNLARTSDTTQTTSITSNSIHDDKSSPEDWLEEFINTPFESNFVSNSKNFNSIGFLSSISPPSSKDTPNTDLLLNKTLNNGTAAPQFANSPATIPGAGSLMSPTSEEQRRASVASTTLNAVRMNKHGSPGDIPSLFRSRQIDLFQKEVENKEPQFELTLFTKALRDEILTRNNLLDSQFPSLEELNKYVYLYKTEFDKYFPFIHLATLSPSIDNYPLLLSIASIGALYAFHSTHAMLMFNITRFRIHEFLEREKKSFKSTTVNHVNSVPIWVYQSMVLLIFIGIFNNDLSITKTMTIFMNSLIELVKLTSLNLPLENFLTPPPVIDSTASATDYLIQEQNFNYFILAQTRIRTCHTILLISNLFTSLIGLDCSLHSIDLKCGIHCRWEELWQASNQTEWYNVLNNHNYSIDSKFALVELSNGNDSYANCLNYLTLNNFILNDDENLNKKFQFKTLLSLLLSIHEKIYLERNVIKHEKNGAIRATKWRMNSRPIIESLIKSWESLYIKNGGVFYLNEASLSVIYNKNPFLRLILPLLSFAKIRKCISLTPIIEKIWQKDWEGMNENLQKLRDDPEALKDSTNYALDIVKLWIDYVSIHQDAEKTSIRTPVFFITCIFSSLLIIAEFLHSLEKSAAAYDEANPSLNFMNANERTLWLRSEMIFKKIEDCLMNDINNKTYSEMLRLEAKGALDVEILDDEVAKRAVSPDTPLPETLKVIQNARLSSRSLYLGMRILGDAPIWPIALVFAQALKARAIHISKSQPPSPN